MLTKRYKALDDIKNNLSHLHKGKNCLPLHRGLRGQQTLSAGNRFPSIYTGGLGGNRRCQQGIVSPSLKRTTETIKSFN